VKTEHAKLVRLREQPMVDELEGMLGDDTKMTLFAIDPTENEYRADPDGSWMGRKMFRGHIVRGSAGIDDSKERADLVHALTEGIRETDESVAACFDPYFALKIERGIRKIDIVVCFDCLTARMYGAYADNSFILAGTHVGVFLDSAKQHDLSLPYRAARIEHPVTN
jgi:hypothetical protein